MKSCDLSIIIVNYQTPDLTLACLDSIEKSFDKLSKEVIVVDNASGDDSVKKIRKRFGDALIIENKTNYGFAKANNVAAKKARGEYLFFLNSDTIIEPDSLSQLMKATKLRQADIASCRLLNPDGSLQPQGGFFPTWINVGVLMLALDDLPFIKSWFRSYQMRRDKYFATDREVDWVGGTALMVKRKIFNSLGGFDESIFMYAEDIDFCYRASLRGFKRWFFAKPEITHLGQGSGTKATSIVGEYKGLIYFFDKHKYAYEKYLLKLSLKIGALLRMIFFGMIVGNDKKYDTYKQAFSLV